MSDPTAPVEGAGNEAAPESTPTADPWAGVHDRVGELAGGVGELANRFDQFLQSQQQPEPEPEEDPWASLFAQEPEPDQYQQQPQGIDPQALQQAMEARIQQGIQQGLSPIQAQMQEITAQRAAEQLGKTIPALADTPANQENRAKAFEMVTAALQNYPSAQANALAADPNFIATVWKAAEADRLTAGQAPAGSDVPALEAAGGALPGGNGAPPDPVKAAFENAWELPRGLR